jgi:hypothetical protein
MDVKLKHLEMIQAVIARMASNSFLLKAWTVTLVSALLALAAKDADRRLLILAYFPSLAFWLLDGYFLRQERLFRKLYDAARAKDLSSVDFSMDTKDFDSKVASLPMTLCSLTLIVFYGAVVGTLVIVMLGSR